MSRQKLDFVTNQRIDEASANSKDQLFTLSCFKNFWILKDRFGFELKADFGE